MQSLQFSIDERGGAKRHSRSTSSRSYWRVTRDATERRCETTSRSWKL